MKIEIVIEPTDEELQSPELPEVTKLWEMVVRPDMAEVTTFQLALVWAIKKYMQQRGLKGDFNLESFYLEFGPTVEELIEARAKEKAAGTRS